ncbi:MAG: hypothetical protein E8D44_14155 [Nitrospira sp.]|jgi:hypothetical protein|nr:MAG: hypothetical protein E8D44_14155 [Nitrospira sp.]
MGKLARLLGILLTVVCLDAYVSESGAIAGSKELFEGLSESLDTMVEQQHCLDQDKTYGSGDGKRCQAQSQDRLGRFQDEMRRRTEQQDAQRQQQDVDRQRQGQQERRRQAIVNGPDPGTEMRTRFGNVITFEECMSVYSDRNATEFISPEEIRNSCLTVVKNVRGYCESSGDNQCVDKGYIRQEQSAAARQDRLREATDRQQQARSQQADTERQRKQDRLNQFLRSGGKRGVCPSTNALLNNDHPCHY